MLLDPWSLARLGGALSVLAQLVGLIDHGDCLVWRWIRRLAAAVMQLHPLPGAMEPGRAPSRGGEPVGIRNR